MLVGTGSVCRTPIALGPIPGLQLRQGPRVGLMGWHEGQKELMLAVVPGPCAWRDPG